MRVSLVSRHGQPRQWLCDGAYFIDEVGDAVRPRLCYRVILTASPLELLAGLPPASLSLTRLLPLYFDTLDEAVEAVKADVARRALEAMPP